MPPEPEYKESPELIADLPTNCAQCRKPICLRQQVLNLALGAEEGLLCLNCLAQDNLSTPSALLLNLSGYVQQRECFLKEWSRYKDRSFCPAPNTCLPDICFSEEV